MNITSNEMILYIGLIIASASIFIGIAYSVIFKTKKQRLNANFDVEYGNVQKRNNNSLNSHPRLLERRKYYE